MKSKKNFWQAVLFLSGMIIGVGMFGIPFAFVKSGFWLGIIELAILTVVAVILHLLYGEIVLATEEFHRLPGYVTKYLGSVIGRMSWTSAFFGITGTLLAYVILGAIFLHQALSSIFINISVSWSAVVISILAGGATLISLKKEASVNSLIMGILIFFIAVLSIFLIFKINLHNITGFNVKNLLYPYGIILFAVSGGVVIPDLISISGKDKSFVRKAIVFGTVIPAVLYALFALGMVGTVGKNITPDAVSSLVPFLGTASVAFASIIGLLAVFTSIITLSESYQALLKLDFGVSRFGAWIFVSFFPLVLYFLGMKNFIKMISIIGALAVGFDSATIIASYHKVKTVAGQEISWYTYIAGSLLYLLILAGVVYTLLTFSK